MPYYHRSFNQFSVGKVLDPITRFGTISDKKHPYRESLVFSKLEDFREKYHLDKPSRFSCIFCTMIPNSAYKDRGNLYEVDVIGRIYTTNGFYINKMICLWDKTKEVVTKKSEYSLRNYYSKYGSDIISAEREYTENLDNLKNEIWETSKSEFEILFDSYWNHKTENLDVSWVEILCDKVKIIKV